MSKGQVVFTFSFVALFLFVYIGFDTKSQKHLLEEKSRALNMESTNVSILIRNAKESLADVDNARISNLESELQNGEDASQIIEINERLASTWFELSYPEISGHFASEIAKELNTEESWAIAGTTFAYGLRKESDQKTKDYSYAKAKEAFENAISINPDNIDHRINVALINTDHPPANNPMKGILQLVDLNEKHPNNVKVLNHLGRLAIQTNQFDKAIERFGQVIEQDPENLQANCLIIEAYEGKGMTKEALVYRTKCENLKK